MRACHAGSRIGTHRGFVLSSHTLIPLPTPDVTHVEGGALVAPVCYSKTAAHQQPHAGDPVGELNSLGSFDGSRAP